MQANLIAMQDTLSCREYDDRWLCLSWILSLGKLRAYRKQPLFELFHTRYYILGKDQSTYHVDHKPLQPLNRALIKSLSGFQAVLLQLMRTHWYRINNNWADIYVRICIYFYQ